MYDRRILFYRIYDLASAECTLLKVQMNSVIVSPRAVFFSQEDGQTRRIVTVDIVLHVYRYKKI